MFKRSSLFESFVKAYKMAGLKGNPDLEDFEVYLRTAPFADWEDDNGSVAWVLEWEKEQGLERTYESKGVLTRTP